MVLKGMLGKGEGSAGRKLGVCWAQHPQHSHTLSALVLLISSHDINTVVMVLILFVFDITLHR